MTRDDASALLPFLANDSLTGDERTEVEAAVAEDADLQAELAALKAIRTTMQTEEGFSPGEIGLARLMRDVDAEAPVQAAPKSRPLFWQVAAATLLAVVVGQGVLMNRDAGQPGFELAGTGGLQITLEATATEAEIRMLMLDVGVEIVSGPSALGLYELRVLEGVDAAEVRATLEAAEIVESVSIPDE